MKTGFLTQNEKLLLRDFRDVARLHMDRVIGNSKMLSKYHFEVIRLLHKWLNRRSQSRSLTWPQLTRRLPAWDLPQPKVVEKPLNNALRQTLKPA